MFFQLGEAGGFIPILDVEISILVKAQAVGGGEDPKLHFVWWNRELRPLGLVRIVAEEGDLGACFVENGDAGLKFCDGDVVA